jgi:polygalacturonase
MRSWLLCILLLASLAFTVAALAQRSIFDHGASAAAKDNTTAIQQAIDAVAESGGGTVIVPAGHFVTGPLRLRSRVTLHLEPVAVLQASSPWRTIPRRHDLDAAHQPASFVLPSSQATDWTLGGNLQCGGAGWLTSSLNPDRKFVEWCTRLPKST